MKKEKIISLCIKNITGNIEGTEKEILNSWLNESKENHDEYERLKEIWQGTAPQNAVEAPDVNEEWLLLSQKLELNKAVQKDASFIGKLNIALQNILGKNLKPAFAVVLVLIAATVIYLSTGNNTPKYELTEVSTGNGIHKSIVLPDSSTVVLNSGSSIKYTEPLNENIREIQLTGEGFFSVRKDGRPFIVKTDNAKITVLGTEFNVWAREAKTKVIVKEGLVNLSDQIDDSKSVKLARSETSTIIGTQEPTEPVIVDADRLLGWMNGELIFNKSSLQEIVNELERFYNVKFTVMDKELNDLTMTGSFKDEDPDTLLSMVCLALGADYIKNENGYIIKKKQASD